MQKKCKIEIVERGGDMCAIFKIALKNNTEVFNKLKDRYGEDTAKKYLDTTLFPQSDIPVLGPQKKVAVMNWGFPLSGKKTVVFNARSETLLTKPLYADCVSNHCIIPATAFYEFGEVNGKKQKYLITLDEGFFYFAGLWKKIVGSSGEKKFCCTIITTTPNTAMAEIHSRMPVILKNGSEDGWLGSTGASQKFLSPYKGETFVEKADK